MKLYDMSDEDYKEYVKGLCLAGLPIPFYNKLLNHLLIEDLFKIGDEKYRFITTIFRLDTSNMPNQGENILDLISESTELEKYFDLCIEFLKMLFSTEDIRIQDILGHREIVIDEELYINSEKFKELSDIILTMCYLKKVKKEDIKSKPKEKRLTLEQIMSIKDTREREYQLAIYNKNKNDEDKQDKVLSLYNVYNYISNFLGNIDYKKPLKLNLYQFYNSFEVLRKTEKYNNDMRTITSGMCSDVKKIDTRFFSERIIDE